MGVNPVTGGDGAMLIKQIRERRWKARDESLLSTPSLLFPLLWLQQEPSDPFCQEKGHWLWRQRMRRSPLVQSPSCWLSWRWPHYKCL